jgi:hypothetical protein
MSECTNKYKHNKHGNHHSVEAATIRCRSLYVCDSLVAPDGFDLPHPWEIRDPLDAGSVLTYMQNITTPFPGADITVNDLVFGSTSLNDIGPDGNSRLLFDKSKSAFRAGFASATQWDDASRGVMSVAFGEDNTADGDHSVVAGGSDSFATGQYAVIGGGENHNVVGDYSVVGGGSSHVIDGTYAVVSGGINNQVAPCFLFSLGSIGGGAGNSIDGSIYVQPANVIGGGVSNTVIRNTNQGVVAGGRLNVLYSPGNYPNLTQQNGGGNIGGGLFNRVAGQYDTIGGGVNNSVGTVLGPTGTQTGVAATGGAGVGATFDFDVFATGVDLSSLVINNAGTGYAVGNILTIPVTGVNTPVVVAVTSIGGAGEIQEFYIYTNVFYSVVAGGNLNRIAPNAVPGGPPRGLDGGVIGGGLENLIQGTGDAAVVPSYSTIPGGWAARAFTWGQHVHANGRRYSNGDADGNALAQTSEYLMRGFYQSGDPPRRLRLDDLANHTVIYIPPNSTWSCEVTITGRDISTAAPTYGHELLKFCLLVSRNNTDIVLIHGQQQSCNIVSNTPFMNVMFAAVNGSPGLNTDNGGLAIDVSDSSGNNLDFYVNALVKTVEITHV